jgi:hypothetical protein
VPGTNTHTPIQELHRCPVGALDLLSVDEVRKDGQPNPKRPEQEQWV